MKRLVQFLFLLLLILTLAALQYFRIYQDTDSSSVGASDYSDIHPTALPSPVISSVSESTPSLATEPTPTPTPEPTPEFFTISVIGDETLTTHQNMSEESEYSYAGRMKGDYSYPFSNTVQYFNDDELTITNLECTLADQRMFSEQTFYFRAPTAYAQILTAGGIDFVTTANNHSLDFGQAGLMATYAALEEYGIPYGKEDDYQIITTVHGLRIGIYCAGTDLAPNADKAASAIQLIKAEGVDYIICAFHWGLELQPVTEAQMNVGRACIDAGANLIFGCHPHCLQPIEEYNGGIILYSMGEFSFGGNTAPKDRDTAIFQITLKRDPDSSISVDSWSVIPCCVSSRPVYEGYTSDNYNDFCPTPYEEDSEDYERVLNKLDGSYTAHYTGADYTDWYGSYG